MLSTDNLYAAYYGGRTAERGGRIVIRLPKDFGGHEGVDLAAKITEMLNAKPEEPAPKPEPRLADWQTEGRVTVRDITDAWEISVSTWKKYVITGRYPEPLPREKDAAVNAPNHWDAAKVTRALRRDKVKRRFV